MIGLLLRAAVAHAAPGESTATDTIPAQECARVAVVDQGRIATWSCAQDVAAGWTVVDLSDDWAPRMLGDREGGARYRKVFVDLAREKDGDLELYGISPTFAVLLQRLQDERRHQCHRQIDDAPLESFTDKPSAEQEGSTARRRELHRAAAVRAVQQHLACEGLLRGDQIDGIHGWATTRALERFRRRHAIIAAQVIDDATRGALLSDSRELDFMATLRALRERVVDATGLIEDGSALGQPGVVLGRALDPSIGRLDLGVPPLPEGAPDRVSAATEAAALALGWTSAEAVREIFLQAAELRGRLHVAVALPPLPAYHRADMALRVEIDRGDVWYDYPYTASGARRSQVVERHPTLTVFARSGDGEVALVRWPTTIGGWQKERLASGEVVNRYKNSPGGDFVWRDVIAAPTWFAPPSTPDEELVRRHGNTWVAREDSIGPGYRSAYGLVMMIHRTPADRGFLDTAVRTHGTVSYPSITNGNSHGCHRLYSPLANRLAGFLLHHQEHVTHGELTEHYVRTVRWAGKVFHLKRSTRGYRHELREPIPVRVLEGRIRGRRKTPWRGAF